MTNLARSLVTVLFFALPIACGDDGDDESSTSSGGSAGSTTSGGSGGSTAGSAGKASSGGSSGSTASGGTSSGGTSSGGTSNAGGAGGSASSSRCDSDCEKAVAADCDNGPSQEQCVAFCEANLDGPCATEYATLQDCGEDKTIGCSADGLVTIPGCEDEQDAFVACLQ